MSLRRLLPAIIGLVVILGVFAFVLLRLGALSPHLQPTTLTLSDTNAGSSFTIATGSTIQVQLQDQFPVPGSSLVWSLSSSDSSVLAPLPVSSPTPRPALGNVPVTFTFHASAAGTSLLHAHGATSCEAMLKSACPDKDFSITIIVGAS
jgi:hypothetical protein